MAKTAPKKPAPAKPAPRKPKSREPKTRPRDAADEAVFLDGREARSRAIPRRDSPHPTGKLRDLWQEGWDFQDGALS